MSTRRWLVTLLLLLGLSCAATAAAQGRLPGGPPPDAPPPGSEEWQEMMDRIATVRIFKLTQALDLDDETAIRLSRYLKDRDEERMEATAQRGRMARDIREFLAGGAADGDRAKELLDEAMELETRAHDLERELIVGLEEVLTPSQQLRFILANREFDREVRQMIREHHQEGRKGPPPGR